MLETNMFSRGEKGRSAWLTSKKPKFIITRFTTVGVRMAHFGLQRLFAMFSLPKKSVTKVTKVTKKMTSPLLHCNSVRAQLTQGSFTCTTSFCHLDFSALSKPFLIVPLTKACARE